MSNQNQNINIEAASLKKFKGITEKKSMKGNQNTFVYKLGVLINDPNYQDSIHWNPDGRSFTVTNIEKFSKTILPIHFKHNNFSSFIRQLNMYGFHKINRSPRGHRTDPTFHTWEFSHKLFVRDRLDQISEIKRSTYESEITTRSPPTPDVNVQINCMLKQQNEMVSTIQSMSMEINQLKRELNEANRVQQVQQQVIRKITNHLQNANINTNNTPNHNHNINNTSHITNNDSSQPAIFITPPEANANQVYNSLSPLPPSANSPMMHPNQTNQEYYFQSNFNNSMLQINGVALNHISPGMAPLGSDNSYSEDFKYDPAPSPYHINQDTFVKSTDTQADDISSK